MRIKINNCNNIENGELLLTEGTLNIKYAINGTGKSTIAHAIAATIKKDESMLKVLTPYKYLLDSDNHKPSVDGIDTVQGIMIFNEEYVSQYVYQPDELIKDSFKIFVKSQDYDKHMKEIERQLKEINNIFQTHNELDELIYNFRLFIDGFGKSKSGYSSSGHIGKGFGKGNKIDNIPLGLEVYSPYLQHTDNSLNVKWIKWQIDGKQYLDLADQCPYCSTGQISSKKKTILQVEKEYDSKSIEHLNKMLQVFEKLLPYFDEKTQQTIKDISFNVDGITTPQKNFLLEIKNQVEIMLKQLENLKNIGFHSLKHTEKVADELKHYIIDIALFGHLNSKNTQEKINAINSSLNIVMERAGILQGEMNKQKKLIKQTIEKNSSSINNFLRCAGYHYEVVIEEVDNKEYRMLLKPTTIDAKIDSVRQHLSYGERNAFALALFMFASLKENPGLIILDDPISSFDGNKKFAIINMLFLSKTCFRNRTVLLLTHDFNTVIDIIHTMPQNFNPTPIAHFLTNKNGVLTEIQIQKRDIRSFKEIVMTNIKEPIDTINKLIYLRRLLEFENEQSNGEKGVAWNLLSNLFHKREVPLISNRNMTPEEIKEATDEIRKYVPEFEYSVEYKKVCNKEKLIDIYRHANSNYEKLQVYRIFHDGERYDNLVVKKFLNEVFHVENDYLFQLNPRCYDTVPQYIIEECDKDVNLAKEVTSK